MLKKIYLTDFQESPFQNGNNITGNLEEVLNKDKKLWIKILWKLVTLSDTITIANIRS